MDVQHSLLDEIRTNVRVRPIPWDGYLRANLISAEDVKPFQSLDNLSAAQRHETVAANSEDYAQRVLKLLGSVTREDLVKYWIVFLDDSISQVPSFAQALLKLSETWPVLESLLNKGDELGVGALVLELESTLASKGIVPKSTIEKLIKAIASKITTDSSNYQDIAIQCLALLLQTREYRGVWYSTEPGTVRTLLKLVTDNSANNNAALPLQELYVVLLVFWLASFDNSIAHDFVSTDEVVGPLLEVARTSIKEKIVRVAIATLANLVRFAKKVAVPVLIAERGLLAVNQLAERKWADEELIADVDYLKDTLQHAYDSMTTYEEYEIELEAGRLRWSPPHKNPVFWQENIDRFRKSDWAALRRLVELLGSPDHVTEAVACHDVAQIMGVDASAVQVVAQGGGKTRLMELISASDSEVRFEALKATQAILANIFA